MLECKLHFPEDKHELVVMRFFIQGRKDLEFRIF